MPAPITFDAPEHVSLTAAAATLRCTRHKVLTLTAIGLLRAYPIAGRAFYRRDDVLKLPAKLAAKMSR